MPDYSFKVFEKPSKFVVGVRAVIGMSALSTTKSARVCVVKLTPYRVSIVSDYVNVEHVHTFFANFFAKPFLLVYMEPK